MNHGDSQSPRFGGVLRGDLFPAQMNRAAIGHIDSRENLAQRALASPVLAHERVATSLRHGKGDFRQGLHPGISLGDLVERQERHGSALE